MRRPGSRRTLTGRVVLTTVAVAVLAVLAVALVGFQLVRQESVAQTRFVLHTSAQAIAMTSADRRSAFAARVERRSDGRIDIGTGGTGTTSGLTTALPLRLEARLASSRDVSARVRAGVRTLLVEAVPARGGGSVIAVEDVSLLHGDQVVWRFAVALGIGLALAVGLGVALARVITRPLRRVAGIAARLADGERGVVARSSEGGLDAVGCTTATAVWWGAPDPAARPWTDGDEPGEVGDIVRALGALDEALARSEARQREFLLSVSHELRTPLTAVRGYADALADGLVRGDDTVRVGGVLVAETERLDAFVRDLLALARLEADDFPIALTTVAVDAVLDQTADAWAGTAARVGSSVRVDSRSGATVLTDPMRLRQVVDGLVENALRVSPDGGEVRLSSEAGPHGVVVVVSDDGPGFAPEDLDRVFQRGWLRDRYRNERPVGTGLGLSIAARLVGRLGGTIRALPASSGSVFVVELPQRH